mmetsp:Transcript_10353/g.24872  ORF Transcript_10353/g.24872 Transcript_10353/m.24872 type:complete len:714 (+) Transcript_10353:391-2532(+)|eukprot:CAMPEP_0113471614 /NCGR_PEP_ID=MMETSP0014_2-20120614/17072_1 /TAXON_ID=2857 /ORGANISM="Nitzschia sp." /LENGTH=713 /DNA_ID=CAMNT_0000364261 /DNA_START=300 /DNA_END=2441 /DNA_ORIENTATION=+ /assembly_acc=CAM_ASM_000159
MTMLQPPATMTTPIFVTTKMKSLIFVVAFVVLVVHCCILFWSEDVAPDIVTKGRTTTEAEVAEHNHLDLHHQHHPGSQQQDSQQRPYFIFHLGPHKTGTSEIQCELSYMRQFLQTTFNVTYIGKLYKQCLSPYGDDGKEATIIKSDEKSMISTPGIVECLDRYQYDCRDQHVWKDFRSTLGHVRKTGSPNILMSDEKFARIRLYRANNNKNNITGSGSGSTKDGIRLLYETLEEFGYDIKLVFVYRHYYAWFYSLYNEFMKKVVLYKYDDDDDDQEESPYTTKLSTWGRNVQKSISHENKSDRIDVVDIDVNKNTNDDKKLLDGRELKMKKKINKTKKSKQKVKPGTPVETFVEYYRQFDEERQKKNQTLGFGGEDQKRDNSNEKASSRLVPQYLKLSNQQQIHPVTFLQRWWTLQDDDDDDSVHLPYAPDPRRGDVILINMHESEVTAPSSKQNQQHHHQSAGQTGDLVIDFIRQALAPLSISPSFIETEIIKFKRRQQQETENKKQSLQQNHRRLQVPSKTNPSIDLNYDLLTFTAAQEGFRLVPEHVMRNYPRDVVTRYTQHNFLSFTNIDPSTIPLECLSPDEVQQMCDVSFKMMTQLVEEQQANLSISSSSLQPASAATVPLEGRRGFIESTPSLGSGRLPPLFHFSSSSSSSAQHYWSDHHNKTFFESFIRQKKSHCQWDVTMLLNNSQDARRFFRSIESSKLQDVV